MEGLGSPSTFLGDLFCMVLLVLEVNCLGVLLIDFVRDGIKGHNLFHEWGRNSGSEETNEDVVVRDAGMGDIILEG